MKLASHVVRAQIGIAWCYDCKETVGPDLLEDVGFEIALGEHEGHDVEVIDVWSEEFDVDELEGE